MRDDLDSQSVGMPARCEWPLPSFGKRNRLAERQATFSPALLKAGAGVFPDKKREIGTRSGRRETFVNERRVFGFWWRI